MMNTGERLPLDDDICRVAGKRADADVAACVATRKTAREAKLKPGVDQALDWLTRAAAAPAAKREAVAKAVFTGAPDVAELDASIAEVRTPLTVSNLQPFAEITADCAVRPAFEHPDVKGMIGICPAFFPLGAAEQARALIVASTHVKTITLEFLDKDCANPGCAALCGSAINGKAWARFIECSAGP
jgi:hypothetical protein